MTDESRRFELQWISYISYAVHNEMYQALDRAEAWEGKLLRRSTRSRFAALVRRTATPIAEMPPELQDWCVLCEWHVVDVIAHGAPRARRLPRE